jgi:hypothetical protein
MAKKRIKVGLVGESPNDTVAVKALWERYYSDKDVEFFVLIQRIRGSELDNKSTKKKLEAEFREEKPDSVVLIRDLDALKSDNKKLQARRKWLTSLNKVCKDSCILLLNIYEIEAWLLADTTPINSRYAINVSSYDYPETIVQPKEELQRLTNRQYSEYYCRELIPKLNVELLKAKLPQYQQFSQKFEEKLEA